MTEGLLFVLIVLTILIYLYFSKAKKYETLLKIAELGETANEELLDVLGKRKGSYKTDYRTGLIWLAIGIPFSLSFFLGGERDGAVVGSIFILIGIAHIISGKYRWREDD